MDFEPEIPEFSLDGVVTHGLESWGMSWDFPTDMSLQSRFLSVFPNTLSPRAPPILPA